MAINFLPIIIIGGAIVFIGKKKKKNQATKKKTLPPANDRGTIFEGDTDFRPSGIKAGVGERFSVTFNVNPSIPAEWKLSASPPDDSIKYIKTERDQVSYKSDPSDVGRITGKDIYIFEGKRPGKGSLVFHFQTPWLKEKEPPIEVVEILTEIS